MISARATQSARKGECYKRTTLATRINGGREINGGGGMIRVKEGINLLELLASLGFTAYELRKQGIFGERTIQKLRQGGLPSWRELDFICSVTAYNVGELIEYKREEEEKQ